MIDSQLENSSPSDEQLVAYLDGELDAAARTEIEDRLAADHDLREQLLRLQQTWDCLDELPATNVDEKFTQTTMAMATVAASQELTTIESQTASRQTMRTIFMTGMLVASLLLGLLVAASLWPDPNGQLLNRLEIFVRLDAYQSVQDVEFLRQLQEQQFFPPVSETEAVGSTLVQIPISRDIAEDRRWIADLSPDKKNQLAQQQQRFDAMPAAERQRIVAIARTIAQDPQAEQLLETLDRYHAWLVSITPGQRADLASLEPERRIVEIRDLQQRFSRDESARQRSINKKIRPLNLSDVEKLTDWMRHVLSIHVAENRSRYVARVPRIMRVRFESMPVKRQDEALMAIAWRAFMNSDRFDHASVSEVEIRRLVASLSPDVQQAFRNASTSDQRKKMLVHWLRTSLFVRWKSGSRNGQLLKVSEEELERHFVEDLSSDRRAKLLALPSDKMRDALRNGYLGHPARPKGPPRHFLPPAAGKHDRRPGRGPLRRPGGEHDGPDFRPRHRERPGSPRASG